MGSGERGKAREREGERERERESTADLTDLIAAMSILGAVSLAILDDCAEPPHVPEEQMYIQGANR